MSFNDLFLPPQVLKALEAKGFTAPTPVQAAAIPIALEDSDLVACAQTGTGKTAAFVIPILSKLMKSKSSRVLILTPTRELANQIWGVVYDLTRLLQEIRACVIIGGASFQRQVNDIRRNPRIVIGTPGRLIDHMQRRTIDFRSFDTIVLDEADRMFDMGFAEPMTQIFSSVSQERQTLLFSATLSPQVMKLAHGFMKNPKQVSVGSVEKVAAKIKESRLNVRGDQKNEKLFEEIQNRQGQMLVFVRTKIRTDRLTKFLNAKGAKVSAIHGGRTQGQREQALSRFRSGDFRVLVATDVASRGLDIPQIETVFNFDLPETREDYIHRIGRTGRAGAEGEAVSFVSPEENRHWGYLSQTKSAHSKDSREPRAQGRRPQQSLSSSRGNGRFSDRNPTDRKPAGRNFRGPGRFQEARPQSRFSASGAEPSRGEGRHEERPRWQGAMKRSVKRVFGMRSA